MDSLGSADVLLFEGFRFDLSGNELFRLDQAGIAVPIVIGSRALGLLRLLVERQGKLISKDAIMKAVWPGTVVEEGNLTVQIAALRRILDQTREQGSCIQTVPGRGYRFVAPVTRIESAASPASVPSSGNGSSGAVAENKPPRGPGAPGQNGRTASAPISRAPHRLSGGVMATAIAALVLVAAVVTALNWHSLWSRDARPTPRLSIVVLPFANLSNDPEQQYFADGVTEDVTTDLSRIAHMFVISRSTAFTYRNKSIDAKQIGRELGVRYVLEGSVRRSDSQVRVNAELIDAETAAHLWAERFDHDSGDLFDLQDEITRRIAEALNAELIAAEAARPVENPDALDYILRGRAAELNPPTAEGRAEAIDMFEQALTLDPSSVEARSRLAFALANRVLSSMSKSGTADIVRAEALIGQALVASPGSPFAHFVKAEVLRAQRRCAEAIPELETAIASNRNWASAYASLGSCKTMTGLIDETIPLEEKAIRLSPRDHYIGIWYWRVGVVHLLQSHTDEAIVWLEKARVATPGYPLHHAWLAAALALKGQNERAVAELTEAQRLTPDDRYSSITHLKAVTGWSAWPNQALLETTILAGLRKAGMPEE